MSLKATPWLAPFLKNMIWKVKWEVFLVGSFITLLVIHKAMSKGSLPTRATWNQLIKRKRKQSQQALHPLLSSSSSHPTEQCSAHLASRRLLQALLCFVHKVLLFKVQIAFKFDQSLKYQEMIASEIVICHRMANLQGSCPGKGVPDG